MPAWWNSNNWAWLCHPRLTTSDSQPITDSGNLSLGLLPQTPQICVGAGLHGLGMSACFIASLTLMTESGGKSLGVDQVVFFVLNGITHHTHPTNSTNNKQVAMITSLWITAENIGSFLGAVGGGAAYDRLITKDISQISVYLDIFYFISSVLDGATPACWSP